MRQVDVISQVLQTVSEFSQLFVDFMSKDEDSYNTQVQQFTSSVCTYQFGMEKCHSPASMKSRIEAGGSKISALLGHVTLEMELAHTSSYQCCDIALEKYPDKGDNKQQN